MEMVIAFLIFCLSVVWGILRYLEGDSVSSEKYARLQGENARLQGENAELELEVMHLKMRILREIEDYNRLVEKSNALAKYVSESGGSTQPGLTGREQKLLNLAVNNSNENEARNAAMRLARSLAKRGV